MNRAEVFCGVDRVAEYDSLFRGKRLGLVTGPTGVTKRLAPTSDVLAERYRLVALYAPEHGIRGDRQAGEAVAAAVDRRTGLAVHSLYGEGRDLTEDMVRGVDLLVFDMQDAGARFYTYLYSLTHVMAGAARLGLPVIVLDRPNPLGGAVVQGTVLDERFASFVGEYPIPARYGMTIGEFARFINGEHGIGCDLTVVPLSGWRRELYYDQTDLPWVLPSPNLPTVDAAVCYPGTCLIEGTNLSEGRGTTKPFEWIGAPWVDPDRLAGLLAALDLTGVLFRPAWFRPTFSKHAGELCGGVQLHVTDRAAFDPFRTGLLLVDTIRRECREFSFLETEPGRFFIDSLLGGDGLRDPCFDADRFLAEGEPRLRQFLRQRDRYLLY